MPIKLFFIAIMMLASCKVKQHTNSISTAPKVIIEKLGVEFDSIPNSNGKCILFIQKADPNFPSKMINAIVLETSTYKILAEEKFVPGYIKWLDEHSLEMLSMPGIIKSNEDLSNYTKIINLSTKKP